MKDIYLGAAYYPELWTEEELDNDIIRMKEIGLNCMRIGEFAWSKMEPKEGETDLSFFEKVVDKLYANGIKTVMCTPSATPPRWFYNKYPDALQVNYNGVRDEVFARFHCCKSNVILRKKNRDIVRELAKTFGRRKGVIGWQLDNEMYPYGEGCFCQTCQDGFKKYLKEKYKTIDNLNNAWGMYRWSLNYDSFDDVIPPRPGGWPFRWQHPSLEIEWFRYHSNNIISYLNEQAEVIREYSDLPIGTDMMPGNEFGYYDVNANLDVAQFNHYDTAETLPDTAFSYDFLRPMKDKPFWVTETQAGWNGGVRATNGYRPQGNCYANTWLPIAKGGEMNLYWLFRSHPSGHELAHGALFNSAGRPYHVCDEIKQAGIDFQKCKNFLMNSKIHSKVALHYSNTAAMNFRHAPMLEGFGYREAVLEKFYRPLQHRNIDIIDTSHSLEGYKTVISPFLTTINENGLKERILKWVEDGGTWIVGPMADIMNDCAVKHTDKPFSFLEELIGVYTKYQLPVNNDVFKAKWSDGDSLEISTYYDAFECVNCKSIATYDGFDFDGYSVIVQKEYGNGKIVLLGSVLDENGLKKLVEEPTILDASTNIDLTERMGEQNGIIVVETEGKDGLVNLKCPCVDLISGNKVTGEVSIRPYQVMVLV